MWLISWEVKYYMYGIEHLNSTLRRYTQHSLELDSSFFRAIHSPHGSPPALEAGGLTLDVVC